MINLTKLLCSLTLVFLFGCSSSTDETTISPPINGPEYLTISADKTIFVVGETAIFTVIDDEDENITSQSVILVDGSAITANSFSPTGPGNYEIKATYQSVTSNKIYVRADPPVVLSSIDVSLSEPAVFIGGSVTLSATAIYSDNTSVDITTVSEFYIDDVLITGNEFTGSEVGAFVVKSVYESITSSDVLVQVVDPSNLPTSFSKKAIVEDFTGTWCGYCPRVSYAASLLEDQTDKVFVVGVHNGDQMANSFGSQLENEYNITGFPTAYVDRNNTWTYPEPNNIDQALNAAQGTVGVGLAIESSLNENTLDMTIRTGFTENITDARLVVFVLEDGIIANQSNYTSYYGGASTIIDFEHNGVLRYAATDILGDATTSILGIHEQSFSVNLNSYGVSDSSNTGILAMLVDESGRVLLNAQYAASNESQDFD
tara:strand:- start:30317 stop:31606 length:1290 start_codon:yes stop_codon:yes gene_type:complete